MTNQVYYSDRFEKDEHCFTGSTEKSESKTFLIYKSPKVDFIPLDILTEFPNLNGIILNFCILPTLKAGLFGEEFQKIEYLRFQFDKIKTVEPEALQYLVKLKLIDFNSNKIESLPQQLFKNNPNLVYIDFRKNKINSIHPNFYDGLSKLKFTELDGNRCVDTKVGCVTCLVDQSELKEKLQGCFDNCLNDKKCHGPVLRQEVSEKMELESKLKSLKDELAAVQGKLDALNKESSDDD
jgi:hypothetical protein